MMTEKNLRKIAPRARTVSTADGICPRCDGYGLVIDAEGYAVPCDCGTVDATLRARRMQNAGIPARFIAKGFREFQAPSRDLKQVLDAANTWAMGFDHKVSEGLLIRGRTGCGKTHIAVAILMTTIERGFSGAFCNFTDLLSRLRSTYNNETATDSEEAILEDLTSPDLLVIDDLGAEMTTDWVRDRLYLIINRRYEQNRPVLITTNCTAEELERRIGPRTASRLYEMCAVPFPKFPDADWRRAAMR